MKRNPLAKAIKLAMTGVVAGSLAACGGGGSSSSSADGSSGTSVGAVTGFGSVFVNGTKFETNGSVDSDDGIAREDQLEKGMILQIKGDWDDRGEGRADRVSYDDTLRGALSGFTWVDEAAGTGTLTLLGQTISFDGRTVFRGASPADIQQDPQKYRVRVSAWRLEDGSFRASFVGARAEGVDFDDDNEVEIEGVVANLDTDAETFTINDFLIDYTSAVGEDDFSLDDLADGIVVEVEGSLESGRIVADEIEGEDDWFDENDDVEVSGTIYDYDDANRRFSISGVTIQINGNTEFDDIRESDLADGFFVEVEGEFRNGVLVAEEIEGQDSDAEVEGKIESIDLSSESMVVAGVAVKLTASTLIEDDDDDDDRRNRVQDLEGLQVGDFLEVEGRQRSQDGGFLEAISIEREDDDEGDDYELEGRVSDLSPNSITIMNLEVLRNDYSISGAEVGDEVEIEYRSTEGGQYELVSNVEVEDDDGDDNDDDRDDDDDSDD
ncbi:DUF5666 domain-containing protein [Marinobacter sp.]|uniref:DUF5666 domain-containing protein n=1 Tax=Marinobacter sp. TaxID=50741 RepID=UPI003561E5E4